MLDALARGSTAIELALVGLLEDGRGLGHGVVAPGFLFLGGQRLGARVDAVLIVSHRCILSQERCVSNRSGRPLAIWPLVAQPGTFRHMHRPTGRIGQMVAAAVVTVVALAAIGVGSGAAASGVVEARAGRHRLDDQARSGAGGLQLHQGLRRLHPRRSGEAYKVFVDDLNDERRDPRAQGRARLQRFCPIGNSQALSTCTSFTEDDKVFAVVGVFIDQSGDAQLCIAKNHQTVEIIHNVSQSWIDEAPQGSAAHARTSRPTADSR